MHTYKVVLSHTWRKSHQKPSLSHRHIMININDIIFILSLSIHSFILLYIHIYLYILWLNKWDRRKKDNNFFFLHSIHNQRSVSTSKVQNVERNENIVWWKVKKKRKNLQTSLYFSQDLSSRLDSFFFLSPDSRIIPF